MDKRMKRLLGLALLAGLALGLSGCIRSRMIITSEPPRADISVNEVRRGLTPIEIPFIWYWYYDVVVTKPGYQTMTVRENLHTPPWIYIPFDLFMEIMPFPIYDTHVRHYILKPTEEI